MRATVAALAVTLLGLLFFAYQSPRVQELFQSSRRTVRVPATVSEPPPREPEKASAPPKSTTPPKPKPTATADRAAGASSAGIPARRPAAPTAKPSVPNDEVTQVLNGVFAARGWHGLALSVTDEVIEISGQVDTEEQRKKILSTLEKARETRRIDAKGLTVVDR